jgi:hypothetical protein
VVAVGVDVGAAVVLTVGVALVVGVTVAISGGAVAALVPVSAAVDSDGSPSGDGPDATTPARTPPGPVGVPASRGATSGALAIGGGAKGMTEVGAVSTEAALLK